MDIDIMQAQLQRLMKYLPMLDKLAEERGEKIDLPRDTSQPPGPGAPNLATAVGAGVQQRDELSRPR